MLKSKYTYKLTPNEVSILSIVINKAFDIAGNTKDADIQMALCIIAKVNNKLSVNIFGRGDIKVSFNTIEALAFYNLYRKAIIISNFLTIQIFTPIDRTI